VVKNVRHLPRSIYEWGADAAGDLGHIEHEPAIVSGPKALLRQETEHNSVLRPNSEPNPR
jgi:hypothetical protein